MKSRDKVTEQYLNALEIDRAEQIVIRSVQLEAFDSELTYLSDDRNSNRKPPIRVFQLNLFIDENGILRAKTHMKNASLETECKEPIVSVGDIVVLKDEQTKRVFWKLGEIVELIVGRDKNIRAAKVKIPTSKGTTVLTRALQHLIPLEVSCSETYIPKPENIVDNIVTNENVERNDGRTRRNAAIIGELKRKDNLHS